MCFVLLNALEHIYRDYVEGTIGNVQRDERIEGVLTTAKSAIECGFLKESDIPTLHERIAHIKKRTD